MNLPAASSGVSWWIIIQLSPQAAIIAASGGELAPKRLENGTIVIAKEPKATAAISYRSHRDTRPFS